MQSQCAKNQCVKFTKTFFFLVTVYKFSENSFTLGGFNSF